MRFNRLGKAIAGGLLLLGGLGILGCGGSSSASGAASGTGTGPGSGTGTTPTATPVQVNLGDAPADWIMAFGMTVNNVTLTPASGTPVSLVATATPMEMTQTMATMQPLAALSIPQGTYTRATVTLASVSMGYLDPVTKAYVQKAMPGPFTAVVPFSPALTVGANPMALNFDMNMGASVTVDGSGNVSLSPVMTAAMASLATSGQTPWTGGMQQMMGSVSTISGSQFSLGAMMGMQKASFTTDATTLFTGSGLAGMAGLTSGMMVSVDATVQPDGSYLAKRVESLGVGSTGMMGGGLVTTVTGNPPTQLTLAASAGQGGGMMPTSIGGTVTVSIPSGTPYAYDADGLDLTGLPFTPVFDPASLAKGQRVAVLSAGAMMSGGGGMGGGMMGSLGTITASAMRLEPQALHGTVSGYTVSGTQASFTLTLPADAAFTTLTGASTVVVYQQAATRMMGLASVANGADVAARGLLFNDAGTYKLVAGWITLP